MADHTRMPESSSYEVQSYASAPSLKQDKSGPWADQMRNFSSSFEQMRQEVADAHAEMERLRTLNAAGQLDLNIMRRMFVVLSQLHLADNEYNAMAIVHDVLTNF